MEQQTTDGKIVEIISVGQHNIHAGPDFTNAHVRIDGQDWVGNIEIHVKASDWYKHHHDTDPAYDNTILHVVGNADKASYNSCGQELVQCELRYPKTKDYLSDMFANLSDQDIPCGKRLLKEPTLLTKGWKTTLLEKRLDAKKEAINQLLTITQQSWAHAFYITLAHNFGFHTNGVAFEMLALQTPLSYLLKHRDSLFQLTAILLGQSGLLEGMREENEEKQALWREYCFMQKKFSLQAMKGSMWKKVRMRPQSAPEIRIRQFAHLIHQSEHLFANLMEAKTLQEMVDILTLQYSDETIYQHVERPLPLGRQSIDILLINTVIPYRYAYNHSNTNISDACTWLEKIKKEDNTIIRQWVMLGQEIHSAADTQALIHLYQNYCQPHGCYSCQIGQQVFGYRQLELF